MPGGEGETWLCTEKGTGREVAIKLVRRPIPKSITQIIQREIKILADLGGARRGSGRGSPAAQATRLAGLLLLCTRRAAVAPSPATCEGNNPPPPPIIFPCAPADGHLNIVHAEEVVLTRTHVGLVMEYVRGARGGGKRGWGGRRGVANALGCACAAPLTPLPLHPRAQVATWSTT